MKILLTLNQQLEAQLRERAWRYCQPDQKPMEARSSKEPNPLKQCQTRQWLSGR